jgi:protein SCO1/2
MILRTRLMLNCPGCDEHKLISVTIIDDVAGPAICDACASRALTQRRHANHLTLAARLAPPASPEQRPFTLTDTSGHRFSFASHARGKLTYLYFGYTHCPDVCPLTMGDIAAALRRVKPNIRRRVEVVFVTVDPQRDTPWVLRSWLDHYNRSFIGLTGSNQAIRNAAQQAGVPLPPAPKNKNGSYGVTHSSFVFPFSPDGRAHVVYAQGFHAADYVHDMPLLLAM